MLEENPVKKARNGSGAGGRRKKDTAAPAPAKAKNTAAKRAAAAKLQKEAPKKRVSKQVTQGEPVPAASFPEEVRYRMVAEAAYFIAERRGFQDGDPEQDWREAEAQISSMIESGFR